MGRFRLASRAGTERLVVVMAATLVSGILPAVFQISRLIVVVPGDPPSILAAAILPFSVVKYAVGLLLGPLAGLVAGLGGQFLNLVLLGVDPAASWAWIVAGGLGGLLAGLIPRALPPAWRGAGPRRLAGAALVGLAAGPIAFLLIPAAAAWSGGPVPLAWGEYVTAVLPNALLAAGAVPLLVVLVEAVTRSEPSRPRPAPAWPAFAVLATVVLAAPLLSVDAGDVRIVGGESADASPQAAPGPGDPATRREVVLSLGPASAIDPSCLAEGRVRSDAVGQTVLDVELVNEADRDLVIAWLDYEGNRDSLRPVPADDVGRGEWGTGHVFVLARPDGTCVAIFRLAGSGPTTLRLRP